MTKVKLEAIEIKKPETVNFILATAHFIKTVEDVYEALSESVPGIKFGLAFCEASGPKKIRFAGTDDEMVELAVENAKRVGTGHGLFIFLKNAYPINVLGRLKQVSEVVTIHCATANPVQVVVVETDQGRGIMGVIDGGVPAGVENEEDKNKRWDFLRTIGYKMAKGK